MKCVSPTPTHPPTHTHRYRPLSSWSPPTPYSSIGRPPRSCSARRPRDWDPNPERGGSETESASNGNVRARPRRHVHARPRHASLTKRRRAPATNDPDETSTQDSNETLTLHLGALCALSCLRTLWMSRIDDTLKIYLAKTAWSEEEMRRCAVCARACVRVWRYIDPTLPRAAWGVARHAPHLCAAPHAALPLPLPHTRSIVYSSQDAFLRHRPRRVVCFVDVLVHRLHLMQTFTREY